MVISSMRFGCGRAFGFRSRIWIRLNGRRASWWQDSAMKSYLYLDDQRFEVVRLRWTTTQSRHRAGVPSLYDNKVDLVGELKAPKGFSIEAQSNQRPIRIRWRGLSGLFYVDACLSRTITFRADSAGPTNAIRGGSTWNTSPASPLIASRTKP